MSKGDNAICYRFSPVSVLQANTAAIFQQRYPPILFYCGVCRNSKNTIAKTVKT